MIRYTHEAKLTPEAFIDLLKRSTLAERRPVDDRECISAMLEHGNLLVTAWNDRDELVGIARSVTDFNYCCYLSDLAVDASCQRQGIGRDLIRHTLAHLGPHCKLVLLAAPKAVDYYPHLGFRQHPSVWLVDAADLPPALRDAKVGDRTAE